MTVSVRMNPLLENELELAAKRQGVSKSQFIVDAVERALGRKDPYQLLQQVRGEFAALRKSAATVASDAAIQVGKPSTSERLRQKLKAQHDADTRDWQQLQTTKASPGVRKSAP
jgi:hypothetical protein